MNPWVKKLGLDWKTWVALLSAASAGLSAFTDLWKKLSEVPRAVRKLIAKIVA
jgi:hypothetical protein